MCVLINRFDFCFDNLEPTTAASLLATPPPPNPKLEKMIEDNKTKSELNWNRERLTDDDMATIAYYLLKDNRVSRLLNKKFKCSIS